MDTEKKPSGIREAWSILLFALCILLFLSLISYDWRDIPLLRAPPNDPPSNFIGLAGAWTAYLLLLGMGLGAYLVPVWLLIFGLMVIFRGVSHIRAKAGLVLVLMPALGCLFELMTDYWTTFCVEYLNIQDPGGVLIQFVTRRILVPLMGEMGTFILSITLILVSVVLFLGMDAILAGWHRIRNTYQYLHGRRETQSLNSQGRVDEPLLPLGPIPERTRTRTSRAEPATSKRRDPIPADPVKPEEDDDEVDVPSAPAVNHRREGRGGETGKNRDIESSDSSLRKEVPPSRKPEPVPDASEPAPEGVVEKPLAPRPVRRKLDPTPAPTGESLNSQSVPAPGVYKLPPLDLLEKNAPREQPMLGADTATTSRILISTLEEFDIKASIENIEVGPVVTRYELLPAPGVRVEKIAGLSNNLALSLKATSVRVQAPIPGKGLVGIEVPNVTSTPVTLREILESSHWTDSGAALPLVLGKDVGGAEMITDLASMPHLLIAGATGSGKTVCVNSILAGLLMSRTPDQLRLILIDPKIVEFSNYNGLPHLQAPVITNAKKVALGLQWAINEMQRRYKVFAKAGVRNIKGFNSKMSLKQGELFPAGSTDSDVTSDDQKPMPYIVIIVDELADLMLTAQAEIENSIARLAQLSRAVGIHMILATQRPSVNVITGTIKANFPARIAFQVAQKVDSRTILDANGADKLLGRGDMLFLPPGSSKLVRAQGAMTSDGDLHKIVEFYKAQVLALYPPPVFDAARVENPAQPKNDQVGAPSESGPSRPRPPVTVATSEDAPGEMANLEAMIEAGGTGNGDDNEKELIDKSIEIIRQTQRASTSMLQRRLRIGYTRAARVMDLLEERGIVGPARGSDPREILIDLDGDIPNNSPQSNGGEEEASS
jgi:S-DNA-T family DNA segregation ATPase FtsK/SpoIIIE